MDATAPSTSNVANLAEAIARARWVWDNTGGDPVVVARAAARCFQKLDTPEAAFWRGNFLTQGYMTATMESASYVTPEIRELRSEGVAALRMATRSDTTSVSAQARYLLGQVDQMDRFHQTYEDSTP